MFQWPVITILLISMFVGRVCPVLQKGHDNGDNDTIVRENNTSNVLNNNSTKKNESSIKIVEDKKEKSTETENSSNSSLINSTNVESTHIKKAIDDGKHNCTSTEEQVDMLNCHVRPHDNDEIIEQDSSTTEPPNTTINTNNKTEASTESQIEKTASHESKATATEMKNMETVVLLNRSEITNKTVYVVATTEAIHLTITNNSVSDAVSKHDTNTSESSITSIAPLLTGSVTANTGSEDIVETVKSTDKGNNNHMPSGVIALVTAISFAIAIAIVYIGMIVWRRYIEYRYGHRELLVNELEFDTNDLRHFEL